MRAADGFFRANRRFAPTYSANFVGVSRWLTPRRLRTLAPQHKDERMTMFYPANSLDLGEPLGEIVDVAGRAVHIVEMGAAGPTIWLENGWLGTTLGWQPFQAMLAAHTRVCAYDRAGIAWSDPSDSHRSAQHEADEFAALLNSLGETDPVILLAWSGGCPVAQIFAADHPERVAGLILMDGIPPGYDLWATQAYPNRYPRERFERMEAVRRFAEKSAGGACARRISSTG